MAHRNPHDGSFPLPTATMSQPLRRYLGSGDALARLQDHANRLRRLQSALDDALAPPLASQCRVANLKEGVLVVFAQSGAAAVRLRQMAPTVIGLLNQAGQPIHTLKVKVLVSEPAAPRGSMAADRSLSRSARDHLEHFAAVLPPESDLRAAIERLARRARTQ